MSARRHSHLADRARRARRAAAIARPELRGVEEAGTIAVRCASASPTSAPVKVIEQTLRALIDAAIEQGRWGGEASKQERTRSP